MRPPSISKEEVLSRLAHVFRRLGYEGATLAELSKETGLHRASLYHYFPGGKEDMAHAVLADLGSWVNRNILAPLREGGKPQTRLQRMMEAVAEFYDGGKLNCLIALFSLSGERDRFHGELSAFVKSWVDALAGVAVESGIKPSIAHTRAEDSMILLQGALILTRATGNDAPFKRVLDRLPALLLGAN